MARTKNLFLEVGRVVAPLLILGLGVGGFFVFGQKPDVPQREVNDDISPLVETADASAFNGPFTIEVEGVAVPHRQITLSAEVGGRITAKERSSRSGYYVTQDDLLLQIDETDYKLECDRLNSQLAQATQEVSAVGVDITNKNSLIALANEELVLRNKQLSRRLKLAERNAISENEADEARRLELAARNGLKTLQNELAALEQRKLTLEAARDLVDVQLKRADVDRKRTRIVSPVTGTVIEDFVEENDYVQKGDPLVKIHETSRMEVMCNLRVEELYWVWLQSGAFRPGSEAPLKTRFEVPQVPVDIVFEFEGAEYMWDGVLTRYEGTGLDQATRTVPCRVLVEEPTNVRIGDGSPAETTLSIPSLITGMYVSIRIPIKHPATLLEIPSTAVRPGKQVWVVRDGELDIELVDVARTRQNTTLIQPAGAGGLQAGDRVITSPLADAKTGMSVQVKGAAE